MENKRDVVIVAYGRSAVGKSGKRGVFRDLHPVDLGAQVLRGILKKVPNLKPEYIDDIIVGNAFPEGSQGENIARLIGVRAGLPYSVPGLTINRYCSSGLNSISIGANSIAVGESDVIVAGGVESMSAIPFFSTVRDRNEWLKDNKPDVYMPMGLTAENVADKYNITRQQQDEFSAISHKKAAKAIDEGRFLEQIIPIKGKDLDGKSIMVNEDQGLRRETTVETLSNLKPVFKENGVVTAGNSSQTSDGAGFVILMSREKASELNIKPIAKFLGFSVAGVDPKYMGIGPIKAIPKVLKTTGLSLDDIDVIELNEAFASQAVAVINELNLPIDRVNPNGGAIALGHPLGATGGVLTCKCLSELTRIDGKFGMITMCIGEGMGAAGIIEKI